MLLAASALRFCQGGVSVVAGAARGFFRAGARAVEVTAVVRSALAEGERGQALRSE